MDVLFNDRELILCFYCEFPAQTKDHIIPSIYGGLDGEYNFVDACHSCNSERGHRPIDEYMQSIGLDKPVPVGITKSEYLRVYEGRHEQLAQYECVYCGRSFEALPVSGPALYCSRQHKDASRRKRRKQRGYALTN